MKKNLIFVVLFVITLVFILNNVKADNYCVGATYNFANGSNINESCTLNGNISGTGRIFSVSSGISDLTIDCNGYWINILYNSVEGFHLEAPTNILVKNCNILLSGNSSIGINVFGGDGYGDLTFDNIIIISNQSANISNAKGVRVQQSNDDYMTNSVINTSCTGCVDVQSLTNTFSLINSSFSTWYTYPFTPSNINKYWYVDVYANDTRGNSLDNIQVIGRDKDDNIVDQQYTNSSGNVRLTLQELDINQNGDITYYSNYSINSSTSDYYDNGTFLNISQNYAITLTLEKKLSIDYMFPEDYTLLTTDSIANSTFNFSCSSGKDISFIQLWADIGNGWENFYSNNSYISGDNISVEIDNIPSGAHTWAVYCNDTSSNELWSDNRTFYVGRPGLLNCADLDVANSTYFLIEDIYGYREGYSYCFGIFADNITMDCQGHGIDEADIAFDVAANNFTLKNCVIETFFEKGILLENGYENSNITNNTIICNGEGCASNLIGINILSDSNLISNNYFYLNGIYLSYTNNNNISFNNITTDTTHGVHLDYSDNNFIEYNNITVQDNDGIYFDTSNYNNINHNNITSLHTGIYLSTSDYNNLTSNYFTSNENGIDLESSDYNNITHSEIYIVDVWGWAGLYLYLSNNNYFLDTNITIDNPDSYGYGFEIDDSSNNEFYYCDIITGSNYAFDMYSSVDVVMNNTFENFNITVLGDYTYAVFLESYNLISSNDFKNFNILTTGLGSEGLDLYQSDGGNVTNNTFTNFNIQTQGGENAYGVYFGEANVCGYDEELGYIPCNTTDTMANNTIKDSVINASGEGVLDIYSDWYSIDNLINCSFNESETYIDFASPSMINVFWYVDVYVNDSNGLSINQANVTSWDINNNQQFTELTNSSGYTSRQTLREYMQNTTATYYDTNYTFNASKIGYTSDSNQLNLTTNYLGNDFFLTLIASVSAPVGNAGLTDVCSANGGTCASSCSSDSRKISYSCGITNEKICCSPNLCILANNFIAQYGITYIPISLDNFIAKYPGLNKAELKGYIDDYNSKCVAGSFSIFDLPYIGKYFLAFGKLLSKDNPKRALTIFFFILIVLIIILYLTRKKR